MNGPGSKWAVRQQLFKTLTQESQKAQMEREKSSFMEKTILLLVTVFFCLSGSVSAQVNALDSLWRPLLFLMGNWVGDGSGKPGEGKGAYSFAFDLEKNILVRKNHNEFPATATRPAAVHDDLMIVYPEQGMLRAIYFDNERHVIRYAVSVSAAGDTVIFLRESSKTVPRFRLSYVKKGDASVSIVFDMAMPKAPDSFRTYLTGSAHRK
jgi:hypothetical protein